MIRRAAMLRVAACLALAALGGCDDLVGFGGDVPPLATLHVEATGDLAAVQLPSTSAPELRVALVWGVEWLPEALCIVTPESPEVAALVASSCRNPLAFTPSRVTASVPVSPNELADLDLFALPSAEVLVGDVTSRVAYGSLVVFDDRDHSGTLELARSRRLPGDDRGPDDNDDGPGSVDIIYGASFLAMTDPDQRLAFREGDFTETGFYPRHGCDAPLPAFSILAAGGFSFADAVSATLAGTLPSEDPATCHEDKPDAVTVAIPLRKTTEVAEVGCEQRRLDSSVRYRQPPVDAPDLTGRPFACAQIPRLPGDDDAPPTVTQLVVGSRPEEACKGLTHYTLLGCDNGRLTCDAPEWDLRANPPAWWPCPQ